MLACVWRDRGKGKGKGRVRRFCRHVWKKRGREEGDDDAIAYEILEGRQANWWNGGEGGMVDFMVVGIELNYLRLLSRYGFRSCACGCDPLSYTKGSGGCSHS